MSNGQDWQPKELPLAIDVESKAVLKRLPKAHAALAELKGIASTIPNQGILINTFGLQEAKDSSAIENIIATHDDLYKSGLNIDLLTNKTILKVQEILEDNKAGFRKLPGTALKTSDSAKTIYTPPQDIDRINHLMSNLERFINDPTISDLDPLVKMAIIHFQFESIHPFCDGNGRTGRIMNILYLILQNLQNLPILYLSSYIIKTKSEYYRLFQHVRETNSWEDWIIYMVEGIELTAIETIGLIKDIMLYFKNRLRQEYKFYSQDLLNNLFKHPYTKIEFIVNELNVSRITAANYLNKLSEDGLIRKEKLGTANYYINEQLFGLLSRR